MEKKANKKGMAAVITLAVVIIIGVVALTVVLADMIKEKGGVEFKDDTTRYTLAGVTNNNEEKSTLINWDETVDSTEGDTAVNSTVDAMASENVVSQTSNSNIDAGDVVTTPATTKKSDEYDPVAEYENLTKNGDNVLSDHHNNKYIKLVSEKFDVDKELLVAIYSEPDTGNNFVLEFDGRRDNEGNVIKSPDTLKKVYQIDKNKNIAVATGKTTGNIGVSYAEGTLCFNMIKTIVMPQYPEYFTGVEK
ncbi:MAG: hypothetical protein IJN94_04280 [Clostridia bacterium]|nr:hypothetical protein [Clostridia bacterium]